MINFEETELRLGLPGGCDTLRKESEESELKSNGKRGFSETETVDLKLNLSTSSTTTTATSMKDAGAEQGEKMKEKNGDVPKPPAKAQVVGWPPVRSFRKNVIMSVQKANAKEEVAEKAFVKVSMDGAPYLRKVDLKMYRSYEQLSEALAKMFGNCGSQGSETKLVDLVNGSEYVPTYEDKDGDWMLVGDVPWEMFVQSCKRLRIMKASEAIGLAPRAVEARNNRS